MPFKGEGMPRYGPPRALPRCSSPSLIDQWTCGQDEAEYPTNGITVSRVYVARERSLNYLSSIATSDLPCKWHYWIQMGCP
jgi:hypothetical protein